MQFSSTHPSQATTLAKTYRATPRASTTLAAKDPEHRKAKLRVRAEPI